MSTPNFGKLPYISIYIYMHSHTCIHIPVYPSDLLPQPVRSSSLSRTAIPWFIHRLNVGGFRVKGLGFRV